MTGPAEIRAVAIVRVSQRDGDPSEHSPEVQVRAIIEHCAQRGYRLDPRDILDENVDTNGKVRPVSGSWDLADRPKLAHAVALVQRRTHHVIVGERFDRLFRDLDVQRQTIKAVEAAGGRLESPKQGALTHATAESELHATMDGAVAQYTKRTAMDRARDAVAVAIEQGKSPAPVPAGYRRVDGHLEPGPAKEVSTVRDAFEKRANGATIAEVQAFLAKRGIHRTVSGVRNMLTSKLYIGEVHFGDYTPNLKAHDPIIDRDVFDAVQKMVVTAGRKAKSERLLARLGILKCASCDGRMSGAPPAPGTRSTAAPARRAPSRWRSAPTSSNAKSSPPSWRPPAAARAAPSSPTRPAAPPTKPTGRRPPTSGRSESWPTRATRPKPSASWARSARRATRRARPPPG